MRTNVKQIKVGLAQPLVVPGDCAENIKRMEHLVRMSSSMGARIVLFSECGITGYDLKNAGLESAIPIDSPFLDKIADQAMMSSTMIVTGLYELDGDNIYNSAVAFYPDGRRVVQRKHNLSEAEVKGGRVASGPRERLLFDFDGIKCAILICADSGLLEIWEELASDGCQLTMLLAAGMGNQDCAYREKELLRPARRAAYIEASQHVCYPTTQVERAMRLGMAIAAVNQCGWDQDTGYFHPGHSSLVDRNGNIAALIPGRLVCEHVQSDLAVGTVHAAK